MLIFCANEVQVSVDMTPGADFNATLPTKHKSPQRYTVQRTGGNIAEFRQVRET